MVNHLFHHKYEMRWNEIIENVSTTLKDWLQRWVESSEQINDQIITFSQIRDEASTFLDPIYPVLYRGMSVSDNDATQLQEGIVIIVPVHRLSSWSKDRGIAEDYAIPGEGGDIGILLRKVNLHAVVDVANLAKHGFLTGDTAVDAAREEEVIVETNGTLTIHPTDVIYYF